jgi:drug/metabolite transporter (DMT)-like permease
MTTTTNRSAYAAWPIVFVLWGKTYLAIAIALETLPPLFMAGFRYIVAGAILVAVLKVRGEPMPAPSSWGRLAVLGILLLGFGNGGLVWAEQTIPSGFAALLVAMTPFWMVGIDSLMPGSERMTRRQIAGLVVGFAGVLMLVWPEVTAAGRSAGFLQGVVAAEIACVGWAIGSSYARRRGRSENVLVVAGFEMIFGGLFLVAGGSLRQEWRMVSFTARTVGAWLYLVFFGGIAGFSSYAYALKHLPVSTVSLYAYVNPVIAVALEHPRARRAVQPADRNRSYRRAVRDVDGPALTRGRAETTTDSRAAVRQARRSSFLEHDLAADSYHAFQHAHPAPDSYHVRLDFEDVAGMNGMPEANALDAREEGETLAVFGFRKNQDGADLGHGLGENRRWEYRVAIGRGREVAFVARHVLDADNTFIDLELRNAIDQQERVAVRQNPFDRGVVQRQRQVHVNNRLYLQMSCGQT